MKSITPVLLFLLVGVGAIRLYTISSSSLEAAERGNAPRGIGSRISFAAKDVLNETGSTLTRCRARLGRFSGQVRKDWAPARKKLAAWFSRLNRDMGGIFSEKEYRQGCEEMSRELAGKIPVRKKNPDVKGRER
jgi:hypothetical protein